MQPGVACVLRGAGESPAPWEAHLENAVAAGDPRHDAPAVASALADADALVVDGAWAEALHRLRSAHALDAAVQMIVVAEPPADEALRRQLLFTPGLGEVWVAGAAELPRLVGQAAEVTRSRRRHRRARRYVEHALAGIEPRAVRRAAISDAYLASLLDASPDPILSVDEAGTILSWNPGAERTLGFSRSAALGRRLTDVLELKNLDFPGDVGSEPLRLEVTFTRADGEQGVGVCVVAPVETDDSRVYAVLLHDITEQRAAQETLEAQATEMEAQAAELEMQAHSMEQYALELHQKNRLLRQRSDEVQRASSSRSRFYAAMSHELRTPLNAILGYNALVLDGIYGPVTDAQRVPLERLRRAANHLLELVNDVLDLSKIEAGRMDVQPERACVPELVTELLDTVGPLATEHDTEVRIADGPPHCIVTDPRRVRQVLLNLLSNAIRFGERKPVRLSWTVTEEHGLRLDVTDEGIGIHPDDLERIFEEFTQVRTGSDSGTGLGLPISQSLARLLGGSLTVQSEPDVGSTFSLTLPPALPDH